MNDLLCGEWGETHLLLKYTKTQRWREEFLKKWPNMKEENVLRMPLSGNTTTEVGNIGTVAYRVECKWEN
jgi:hypothetical protein